MVSEGKEKHIATVAGRPDESVVGHVSALYFSSASAVLEFLNASGNAALLDGPIFSVQGLLDEHGEPQTIFAIPTGIGRLLSDFRGTPRGVANAVVVVCPEAGLNDGLLSVVVRTHNHQGISARAVLCCDFGAGWSRASVAEHLSHSPAKKLRGALDACFAEQAKQHDAPAAEGGPAGKSKPNQSLAPTPGAGQAAPAPSTASSSAPGATQPQTAGTPAKKPKTDKQAEQASAGAASVTAATAAAAPSGTVGAAAAAGAAVGPAVGTVDDWEVTISGSNTLMVQNLKGHSRKLPPKLILQSWRAGRMEASATAVKQFEIAKSSELVVGVDATGKTSLTSLASYVQVHSLKGVYQHGACPAGTLPDKLVTKKIVGYVPAPSELVTLPAVATAVQGATTARLAFMVGIADGKAVPVGIALVTGKQLVVSGILCERLGGGVGSRRSRQAFTLSLGCCTARPPAPPVTLARPWHRAVVS